MIVNPTVLADPTAAPESEQPSQSTTGLELSSNGSASAAPGETVATVASTPNPASTTPNPSSSPEPASESPAHACANCGAALEDGQDWCLQCGAATPGSLDSGGPSWRSATIVLAATAALVLGAAAAAYAALTQPSPPKAVHKVVVVAQAPTTTPGATPGTTPGTTTTPGAVTTPSPLGTPTTVKPLPSTTPPLKIPLTTPTPKSSGTTITPTTGAGKTTTGTSESGTSTGTGTGTTKSSPPSGGTNTEPNPILLDTNAASTYNPYGYPASNFGDPSLAIDGETSTAWTAQVEPAVAPKMAEGLVVDLKTAQRVAALTLISSTPGMTVQVYGANSNTLPTSITDPAWVALSPSLDAKKRKTHIVLRDSSRAFRFFTLWISGAPASSVGTASAPGHVSVNELELFAAK